jgi:hypothetical protein
LPRCRGRARRNFMKRIGILRHGRYGAEQKQSGEEYNRTLHSVVSINQPNGRRSAIMNSASPGS